MEYRVTVSELEAAARALRDLDREIRLGGDSTPADRLRAREMRAVSMLLQSAANIAATYGSSRVGITIDP